MSKRKHNEDGINLQKKESPSKNIPKTFQNNYNGYYPESSSINLDVLNIDQINKEEFYTNYIKPRKPVVIEGIIPSIDIEKFKPENIPQTLDSDDLLLVEKKFKGGFGSGTQRIKKTFSEFIELLNGKDGDNYYLTTQYVEDDPDELNQNNESNTELTESLKVEKDDNDDDNDQDHNSDSDDEEEEEEDIEGFAPPIGNVSDFSDTESIDFQNMNDDFDDYNESDGDQDLDEEDIVTTAVPGEPLTVPEAIRRAHELVQKPLTSLLKSDSLPLTPELMDKLTPQQINIWIGSSKPTNDEDFKLEEDQEDLGLGRRVFSGGSSSGLHHDHADNLYLPVKGSKRFTIFAPSDAEKMYTVGDINVIHESGVIDYKNNENAPGWRSLRGDSAIITEVAKWRLDNDLTLGEEERESLIKLIEEEEELLDVETNIFDSDNVKKDPPSFSTIPASIVQLDEVPDLKLRSKLLDFAQSKWPLFFKAQRITVHLKPGQMLYLPAGWFHEVTSFGDAVTSKVHIALNYWYSPPNDSENVYSDAYWKEDFQRTLESCKYYANN